MKKPYRNKSQALMNKNAITGTHPQITASIIITRTATVTEKV